MSCILENRFMNSQNIIDMYYVFNMKSGIVISNFLTDLIFLQFQSKYLLSVISAISMVIYVFRCCSSIGYEST